MWEGPWTRFNWWGSTAFQDQMELLTVADFWPYELWDIPWNLGIMYGRYLQYIGSWNDHGCNNIMTSN